MRSILPLTVCLALAPLTAQKMGQVNNDAPTVTQTIRYANGASVKVQYFAISIAEGKTLSRLLDKENGGPTRARFNRMADQNPLGSLETSSALSIAGKSIAKGSYALRFHIDDNLHWSMSLTGKGDDQKVHRFDLKAGEAKSAKRMMINLIPGDKAGSGTLSIRFSNLSANFKMGGVKPKPTSRGSRRRRGK